MHVGEENAEERGHLQVGRNRHDGGRRGEIRALYPFKTPIKPRCMEPSSSPPCSRASNAGALPFSALSPLTPCPESPSGASCSGQQQGQSRAPADACCPPGTRRRELNRRPRGSSSIEIPAAAHRAVLPSGIFASCRTPCKLDNAGGANAPTCASVSMARQKQPRHAFGKSSCRLAISFSKEKSCLSKSGKIVK